jgi:mRNA-degrading endonuclease RelE of RelBE toxin-antitoxin system
MSRAQQIFYSGFDQDFFKLPANIQRQIEAKIDEMGGRLGRYPHYHMTGSDRYRLRVGTYRVIYRFDVTKNEIHLLAVGHRRDIYR